MPKANTTVKLALVGALLMPVGCITPAPDTLDDTVSIRRDSKLEIGEVSIEADLTPEIDEVELLRAALEKAARKREILWSGDPAEDRYRLNLEIVAYEPGNAFKRWMMPGYGSTILHVQGELIDVRDGSVAGKIDHQQSVAQGGAYTIGAWKSIFGTLADDIITDLEQLSERKGFVVALVPWSAQDVEVPRATAARTFSIGELLDARPTKGKIGTREAAFGASMGNVYASRDVPTYLREVLADELRRQGHRLVLDGSANVISGQIDQFWLHTNATPFYWDVIAEVELTLSVVADSPSLAIPQFKISCASKDRTYIYPSAKLMGKVLRACVAELMQSLREALPKDEGSTVSLAAPKPTPRERIDREQPHFEPAQRPRRRAAIQ